MTTALAGAVLALIQGPYLPAAENEAPANAPVWAAGRSAEEHSFTVTAAFECPADTDGGYLQVSISDTVVRASFGAEENTGRRVLSLQVPARQLRGLKPALFCPEPAASPGPVVKLKSRFTAQGALVCRSATGKRTADQTSVALDAWVRCPPLAEEPSSENGAPSLEPGNEGPPRSEGMTLAAPALETGQRRRTCRSASASDPGQSAS